MSHPDRRPVRFASLQECRELPTLGDVLREIRAGLHRGRRALRAVRHDSAIVTLTVGPRGGVRRRLVRG